MGLSLFFSVNNLRAVCMDHTKIVDQSMSPSLESIVFSSSPSQVLYSLQVRHFLMSIPFLRTQSSAAVQKMENGVFDDDDSYSE